MITDYLKLGIKNIRKRKLRSWLTIIGIIVSIATIFILISLSIGLQNAVNEQFRMLGADKFFILPKGQAGAPGSGGAVELTLEDVRIIKKVSGIKSVSYFNIVNVKIKFNDKTRYYMAVGVPLDDSGMGKVLQESLNIRADKGRLLKKEDKGKHVVGLGSLYNEVFDKPVNVNNKIEINDIQFEVIGILKSVGNNQDDQMIYMPFETVQEVFNTGDRVDEIFIQIDSGEDIKKVADNVARKLRKFRNVNEENQDFSILTPEELLQTVGTILNIITSFLLGIAGISLVVGAIGVANTMYTSVLERTKEIGTMKAVGAKNSDILILFLVESGLLGLVGGIFGVILGIIGVKIIEQIAMQSLGTNLLQAYVGLPLIFGCLGFAFVIGSLSGVLPARQASKLKPVDALRYE